MRLLCTSSGHSSAPHCETSPYIFYTALRLAGGWIRTFHLITTADEKLLHLSEFAQQLWDARQSLRGPLEVPVLKHQLNQLRIPGAHRLLQDWHTHTHSESTFNDRGCSFVSLKQQSRAHKSTHWSSPARYSASGPPSVSAAPGSTPGGPDTQPAPAGCAPSDPGAPHPAAETHTHIDTRRETASAQCSAT